ncbi:hypothetical protein QBC39DRAFT_366216 [Podospora conica]|nr:hypothetical protein QBC39DRAFT_366216 [Schizothecium conicum]
MCGRKSFWRGCCLWVWTLGASVFLNCCSRSHGELYRLGRHVGAAEPPIRVSEPRCMYWSFWQSRRGVRILTRPAPETRSPSSERGNDEIYGG